MKVSIIIPVYNTEKFLTKSIESAINQTYEDIEIIAVNDGSTDNSLDVLNRFSEKIKIITKENGGTSSALNKGIQNSNGEWIKWLSSDDILSLNAVEELVNEAKTVKNYKKKIFFSNYDLIDSNGKVLKKFIEPKINKLEKFQVNTILLDHYFGNAGTSLLHKSIFENFGMFDETIGFQEDYEFWLRLCLQNGFEFYLISKSLMKYRIHENQLTHKNIKKAMENAKIVRNIVLDKLDSDLKMKYVEALKQYQKSQPINKRILSSSSKIMFKILPNSILNKLINFYSMKK